MQENQYYRKQQKTPEGEILDYLRKKTNFFGTEAKPLLEPNRTMTLWYGLRLIQLDVDEKSNVLTTSVWTRQVHVTWTYESYLQ